MPFNIFFFIFRFIKLLTKKNRIQDYGEEIHEALCGALEEITIEKQFHDKCLSILFHALHSFQQQSSEVTIMHNSDSERVELFSTFRSMLSSTLMTTLPPHFPGITTPSQTTNGGTSVFLLYFFLYICHFKLSHIFLVSLLCS